MAIKCEVEGQTRIATIKQGVFKVSGLHMRFQRLTYEGCHLANDLGKLSDYNVPSDGVLSLGLQLFVASPTTGANELQTASGRLRVSTSKALQE